jgi:hypothetical protein
MVRLQAGEAVRRMTHGCELGKAVLAITGMSRLLEIITPLIHRLFAKFGNSLLVSLDEVLFEGGTATRGDTVSKGLWDRRKLGGYHEAICL